MKRFFVFTLMVILCGASCVLADKPVNEAALETFHSSETYKSVLTGPKPETLPAVENCAACHNVPGIYDELSSSLHDFMTCLECHVPGKAQKDKYSADERTFCRLGYYEPSTDKWMETNGNAVCLRCHMDREGEALEKTCWECHMRVQGTDEFVLVKDNNLPPTGDNVRVKKIFKHRSHTFRIHPEQEAKTTK